MLVPISVIRIEYGKHLKEKAKVIIEQFLKEMGNL